MLKRKIITMGKHKKQNLCQNAIFDKNVTVSDRRFDLPFDLPVLRITEVNLLYHSRKLIYWFNESSVQFTVLHFKFKISNQNLEFLTPHFPLYFTSLFHAFY